MKRISPTRVRLAVAAMTVAVVVPVGAVLAVPQAAGAATTAQTTNTSLPGASALQAELDAVINEVVQTVTGIVCQIPGTNVLNIGCGIP